MLIKQNNGSLRRVRVLALLFALLLLCQSVFLGCSPKESADGPIIGIAWRGDTNSEFYTNITAAVEKAGGKPVLLEQVVAQYLTYDDSRLLTGCSDEVGALTLDAAAKVKENLWDKTNVKDVVKDIDAVIFTGGEDISSSLYATPEPWHGIEAEIDYNATRDVSDYILMSYCIEKNIAAVGFCRGMQMLAVVSGAKMIQDVPTYFDGLSKEYQYQHRNEKATPESYRDYAPHDVSIVKDSLAHRIYGTELLSGCPSWHHQAVLSVENTNLTVSGSTPTNGENMIEIIEYSGKDFIIGLQFHPEAALVKHLEGKDNAADFMNYETSLLIFKTLVDTVSK